MSKLQITCKHKYLNTTTSLLFDQPEEVRSAGEAFAHAVSVLMKNLGVTDKTDMTITVTDYENK